MYSQEELDAITSVYPKWKSNVRHTESVDVDTLSFKNVQGHISSGGKGLEVTATEKDSRYSDCIITLTGTVNDVSLGMFTLLNMFHDSKVVSQLEKSVTEYDNHYLNRFLFPAEPEFYKTVKDLKELCFFRMLVNNSDLSKVFGKEGKRIDGLREKFDLRMKASRFRLPQSDDRVLEVEGLTKNIVDALVEINNLILYESGPDPTSKPPPINYIPHLHKNNAKKRKRTRPPTSMENNNNNNNDIDDNDSSSELENGGHYENFDDVASDGTRVAKPRSRAASRALADHKEKVNGNHRANGLGRSSSNNVNSTRVGNSSSGNRNKDSKNNSLRSPVKVSAKLNGKLENSHDLGSSTGHRNYTHTRTHSSTSNHSMNSNNNNIIGSSNAKNMRSPTSLMSPLSDAGASPVMDKQRSTSPISKPIMRHNTEGSDSDEHVFIDIILIPEEYVGRLVGKAGKRLVSLRKFTRSKVIIGDKGNDDSKYRKFTITSTDEKNVERAKELLQENLVEEQRRDREKLEKKIKKHLREEEE